MLKYADILVTFSEIPDMITLCINIAGCPCHCKGCHSPWLWDDYKDMDSYTDLTKLELRDLIKDNEGIDTVAFMGGDSDPEYINKLARWSKEYYPDIKVAWYSGREYIAKEINLKYFDYVKIGPYIEERGPLNSVTTNQKMFKVLHGAMHKTNNMFLINNKFLK